MVGVHVQHAQNVIAIAFADCLAGLDLPYVLCRDRAGRCAEAAADQADAPVLHFVCADAGTGVHPVQNVRRRLVQCPIAPETQARRSATLKLRHCFIGHVSHRCYAVPIDVFGGDLEPVFMREEMRHHQCGVIGIPG